MQVCYLDFDGVLHDDDVWFHPGRGIVMATQGRRLFEWESILIDLLAPYPQVKIVLSTAWVRAKSFSYAKGHLDPLIQERVIGATFHHRYMNVRAFAIAPRGMQVWDDVHRREPLDWFAIDDDGFGWPSWCRDRLVLTTGTIGLSETAVQKEIRKRLSRWSK